MSDNDFFVNFFSDSRW